MRIFAVAVALTWSAVSVLGQSPTQSPPPAPTAAISGIVVDGSTDAPVENAAVSIQGASTSGMFQTRQYTDAKGRFVFANLPAALDYTLVANVPGYFTGQFTRESRPTTQGTAIPLAANEWVRDVRITVWKPGSISGRVLDEAGEPVVGVFVRALQRVPIAGREQLISGAIAITDDRGVYRIAGLNAGRYLVQVPSVQAMPTNPPTPTLFYAGLSGRFPIPPAPLADGRGRGYPITFYPGARSVAEASPIEVELNEDRGGVDISLAPVPLFSVSGTVQGPANGLTLRLLSSGLESLGIGSEASASSVAPDGTFSFVGVPAGAYVLDLRRRVPEFGNDLSLSPKRLPNSVPATSMSMFSSGVQSAPRGISLSETQYGSNQGASSASARMNVVVDGSDIQGLMVPLRPGGTMEGTVELDLLPSGSATPPRPAAYLLTLMLDPVSGEAELGMPQGAPERDAFRIEGIKPGAYILRARVPGWVVKSVTWNGDDYTNRPFDVATTNAFAGVKVTLTNRLASIAGTVKETNAAIIAFPADQALWTGFGFNPPQIKTAFTSANGAYRIEQLPAGDYFVVAVDSANSAAWLEPGFFQRMAPVATRLSLGWGESGTANLSIVVVRR